MGESASLKERTRPSRVYRRPNWSEKCQLKGWDITREGIAKIELGKFAMLDDSELVYLSKVLTCVKPELWLGFLAKGVQLAILLR